MNTFRALLGIAVFAGLIGLQACSTETKSPDVTDKIHDALKQAGIKDVSVSQDREKGVVTLNGAVASEVEKNNATRLAKVIAGGQVVANEIAVLPPGVESTTKEIDSDLDGGIKKNLDAALIKSGLHNDVEYAVKNGVVTLTGKVSSQSARAAAQQIAASVPNVAQVVNKLDVENQKPITND
jgi:osmotically-inducible protein OsmY